MEGGRIEGGLIADWYPGCSALELIYIAGNPDGRGKGTGSGLLKEGLRLIKEAILAEENGKVRNVTIRMPELYCYTSEGITHYRSCLNRTLTADISLSVTFPATYGKAVVHMSITPAKDTFFNDLDVIKLIKPHGSHQENYMTSSAPLYVLEGSQKSLTDTEFLQRVIGGRNFVRIPEGVTQVDTQLLEIINDGDEDSETDSYDDFYSRFITDSNGKPEDKVKNSMTNRLLCGLILGIFDYKRMDVAEIIDTVRPIAVKRDSFMVLCRGHLIKFEEISEEEIIQTGCRQRNMTKRDENLVEKIGILKARDMSSSDIIIELVLGALAIFEIIGVLDNIVTGEENFPVTAMIILGVIFVIEAIRWIKARIS